MAKILLTPYWVEIKASATEPAFINLISHVSGIHAVRQRDTYRCSRALLPDVLFYLRGVCSPDDLPDGAAKDALVAEYTRRTTTAELKQHGTDKEWPGLWGHQNLGVALAEVNDRYNILFFN